MTGTESVKADGDVQDCERERLKDRRNVKQELAVKHTRAKKVKLVEASVHLQGMKVAKVTHWNEILLLTDGPG